MYVEGVESTLVGGPAIVNCLFTGNLADLDSGVAGSGTGSAAYLQPSARLTAVNSTFTLNIAEAAVGATIHHDDACPTPPTRPDGVGMDSCIMWNNTTGASGGELVGSNGVQYSCVENLSGVCTGFATAVIDDDPGFMNAANNFRLSSGSPCIDEGYSQTIEQLGDAYDLEQDGPADDAAMPDLDNRTRIVGAYESGCHVVDMGCYEFASGGCTGDIAPSGGGDGLVNIDDLLAVVGGWGPCPMSPTPCPGDISPTPCGDGPVNIDDLLAVISAWGTCPGPTAGSGEVGDIPEEFWDCYDRCSEETNFGECMDDCFKALCELGYTEFCD